MAMWQTRKHIASAVDSSIVEAKKLIFISCDYVLLQHLSEVVA